MVRNAPQKPYCIEDFHSTLKKELTQETHNFEKSKNPFPAIFYFNKKFCPTSNKNNCCG